LVHRIGVGREAGIQRYKQGEVVFEGSQVVIKLQSRIVAAFVDDPVEYAGVGIFEQGSHHCFEVAGIDHIVQSVNQTVAADLGVCHIFERVAHVVALDVVHDVVYPGGQGIQKGTLHMRPYEFGGQVVGNTIPKRIFAKETVFDVMLHGLIVGSKNGRHIRRRLPHDSLILGFVGGR